MCHLALLKCHLNVALRWLLPPVLLVVVPFTTWIPLQCGGTHHHLCSWAPSPCLPWCSDQANCHKNHIHYYKDRHGKHASLKATHFKNESIKGEQDVPIFPALLSPLCHLEKAIHSCYSSSKLLFFGTAGTLYKAPYFSYVCSKAISPLGVHLTATDVRHMFVTLWRDFVTSPTTTLVDLSINQACASAADLMLNSTTAWDISYDDTNRSRAIHSTQALWPKFTEFVHQSHLDFVSKQDWNPIDSPIHAPPSS